MPQEPKPKKPKPKQPDDASAKLSEDEGDGTFELADEAGNAPAPEETPPPPPMNPSAKPSTPEPQPEEPEGIELAIDDEPPAKPATKPKAHAKPKAPSKSKPKAPAPTSASADQSGQDEDDDISLNLDQGEPEPEANKPNFALIAEMAAHNDDGGGGAGGAATAERRSSVGGGGGRAGEAGEQPTNELTVEQRAGETGPKGPLGKTLYFLRRRAGLLVTIGLVLGGMWVYRQGAPVRERISRIERHAQRSTDVQGLWLSKPWVNFGSMPEEIAAGAVKPLKVQDTELELTLSGRYDSQTRKLSLSGERRLPTLEQPVTHELQVVVPTALMRAILRRDDAAVDKWLEQRPDWVNEKDRVALPPEVAEPMPMTPAEVAIRRGDVDLLRRLLEAGAQLDWKTHDRKLPPLHLALKPDEPDPRLLRTLLEQDVDVNEPYGFESPLDVAMQKDNRSDLVPMLKQVGAQSALD